MKKVRTIVKDESKVIIDFLFVSNAINKAYIFAIHRSMLELAAKFLDKKDFQWFFENHVQDLESYVNKAMQDIDDCLFYPSPLKHFEESFEVRQYINQLKKLFLEHSQ